MHYTTLNLSLSYHPCSLDPQPIVPLREAIFSYRPPLHGSFSPGSCCLGYCCFIMLAIIFLAKPFPWECSGVHGLGVKLKPTFLAYYCHELSSLGYRAWQMIYPIRQTVSQNWYFWALVSLSTWCRCPQTHGNSTCVPQLL